MPPLNKFKLLLATVLAVTFIGGIAYAEINNITLASFAVSSKNITTGQSVTLSWIVFNGTQCTATGGFGNWAGSSIKLPFGNKAVSPTVAGTYLFTLSCQGASAAKSVSVMVSKSPTTQACNTPSLLGITNTWQNLWRTKFPLPIYANKEVTIPRTGYVAYEFFTGSIVDNGALVSVGNTKTTGVRTGAISKCPGSFDTTPECTYKWGLGGGIRWATDGRSEACQLQPNTTYYFNVTFTDGVDPKSTTCTRSPCISTLQTVNPRQSF